MDALYSIFFGAGVAGFVYSKMGRRVGYGNATNVWLVVGISFIIAAIFFYTLMAVILNVH
jgi:beta-lactamase regulating signal transducer with metallopeptidase domain